jgi:hypothetical protein
LLLRLVFAAANGAGALRASLVWIVLAPRTGWTFLLLSAGFDFSCEFRTKLPDRLDIVVAGRLKRLESKKMI